MDRFRIIVHGKRATDPLLQTVVDRLRQGERHVDVRPTWEGGDALALAAEASALGVDVVVAAGGDGTIHEVVNGIARGDDRPALGFLPLGTANDFARSAGVDPASVESIVAALTVERRSRADLARVGDRFFLNVGTGGFPVEAQIQVDERMKAMFGGLSYLLSGVANLGSADTKQLSVSGPDFEWEGSFYGFAIANARAAGGGHVVAPNAVIDDGLLDLVIMPAEQSLLDSTAIGADLKIRPAEEHVLRWTTPEFTLSSETSIRMNLDGEPYELGGTIEVAALPDHLHVCLPSNSPLLSKL